MCQKSWGRNSYARVLVEVSSLNTLKESLVVAIPYLNGKGHSLETVDVEYEWKPPRCETCKVFNHNDNDCPKREKRVDQSKEVDGEGFIQVIRKNGRGKQNSMPRQVAGIKLTKSKPNIQYRVVKDLNNKEDQTNKATINKNKGVADGPPVVSLQAASSYISDDVNLITIRNSFDKLMSDFVLEEVEPNHLDSSFTKEVPAEDDEDVEDIYNECDNIKGASTLFDKVMHICIDFKADKKELFCSFIYAHNRYIQRRELWQNLLVHKNYIRNRPWCITGDFNVSLFADDRSTGACAVFQPYRISDHAPAIIRLPMNSLKKPRPFKFYNLLVHNTRFKEVLLYDYGNLNDNVNKLHLELDAAQKGLDADPSNMELREEEAAYLLTFQDALLNQERLLKQKSKVDWLQLGDANTSYFHKVVKSQATQNRIDSITTADGVCIDQDQVPIAFINHYTEFLGQSGETTEIQVDDMFCNRLSEDVANSMIRDVTDKEIKEAMFSLGDNKAPGPDGYSAAFFKDAWDIVASDVIKAIKEYFTNGILLKELNHTIIALIPKVQHPLRINDYRPISCCNVLFKCISKIISNRMKEGLSDLVSLNQSAFVPSRRISDNILLTQELMHNYHLDRGPARCAFKVDIQKAYDTVDWRFLKKILIWFGFHARMVGWIMECVTSTSFSISINGCLHGSFKGKRGLRQGDPMSPYLLTLVMEVLTLILKKKANESEFTYHRYCSKLNISNLCFADDLFLFAHGDIQSASVIMESMEVFKTWSGLIPSLPKSKECHCSVLASYIATVLILMERFKGCIKDWKNKALSLAGRAQLIRSVIGSMHLFWASVFIIPSRLLLELEQVMRGFLWCQGELRKASTWPTEWSSKYPLLNNIVMPHLSNAKDELFWKDLENKEVKFLVSAVWENIRPRSIEVDWFSVVWFSQQIPRHAILLWLIIKRKLKTQDMLRQWNVAPGITLSSLMCPLCETQKDSHEHLFFDCRFSKQVWTHVKSLSGISNIPMGLSNIVDFLIPLAKKKSARCVIAKLLFAASCYFIWQERNERLFSKKKRTCDQIMEIIKTNVRLKLLSCRFKKTNIVQSLCDVWKLPNSLMSHPLRNLDG
ncbi:reverse transcriptase domain-containing protein [Tanacetum coccineum]